MHKLLLATVLFISLFSIHSQSQDNFTPYQPTSGPGSADYKHSEVKQVDQAQSPDGFWLYEPAAPVPKTANVIVFIHGYGGYNPMIYGKWIKHLVKQGNIVIYPRYQKNNVSPRPPKFVQNVAQGIKDALIYLENKSEIKPMLNHFSFVGHSYGGVISANLAIHYDSYDIPKPKAVMLVSPGSGPFKGGILDTYEEMPSDLKLLVMVSNNDRTVGDKIGIRVYETATNVVHRNFIRQYHDASINPPHSAGHNESYSVDLEFDNGIRNFTAKRALRMGEVDNVDYFGYWKLFDALLDCSQFGDNCEYAFGNTPQQTSLGLNANGQPLRSLEVKTPKTNLNPKQLASKKTDNN